MIDEEYAINTIQATISQEDVHDSTVQSLPQFARLLVKIEPDSVRSIVALGSGIGGLAKALGKVYEASSVHAVDVDETALATAEARGLTTHNLDLETQPLPFDDDSVDLIVSLGLLEHLTWFDNVVSESKRALKHGGHAIYSLPNLAGWTNRLSILLGKQPRNVEFSRQKAFGIAGFYDTEKTVNHMHTATIPAFREFLNYNGLNHIKTVGLHPYQSNPLVKFVDRIVSYRPTLCRRFALLAEADGDQ